MASHPELHNLALRFPTVKNSFHPLHCLLAAAIALPGSALAQHTRVLEEVVVTAEHREASLQDTQISATAFSEQHIQDLGISNGTDLGHTAPNLVVNSYQGGKTGVSFNMRGIAENESSVAFDPAVGVYLDNVLLAKNVGSLLDVADLERIEVLRGPQGTLYGRNTMGGAVSFVTKKPTDVLEGKIKVTLGNYGQKDLHGVLNVPLVGGDSPIGELNMRISAATLKRDGFTDNDYHGPTPYQLPLNYDPALYGDHERLRKTSSELENKDRQAGMLHLQWMPTDKLTVLYSYDITRIDETPGTPWVTYANPALTGGRLQVPYAIGKTDRPSSIAVSGPHIAETDVEGHSLHIDYALTDGLTFKSITAVREMENISAADSDGSPVNIVQTADINKSDQFTQEFRLTGNTDRWDYTVGLFYMAEDGSVDARTDIFGRPERMMADFENKNWALYGQATYALTERLRLTGGLRYTEEEREMSKVLYARGANAGRDFGTAKNEFDNLSPMVSLGYDINENTMTYLKVSTGFQSGGFNIREQNLATFYAGFDEETLLAYEWGLKTLINDRVRINTALWYSDYDDKRVNMFDPATLGNSVQNAGVVEIYGLEFELLAQLTDQLQFGFTYGYQHPEFKEYDSPNPACVTDPACSPPTLDLSQTTNFPYSPKHSAGANLTYETDVSFGVLRARVDWAWKDSYHFMAEQPERNYQRAYSLWNARLTLDELAGPGDTRLRVSLWGKNLTDEPYYYNGVNLYRTLGFDVNLYGEPRTFGIDLEMSF